jgi:hypothetical protein
MGDVDLQKVGFRENAVSKGKQADAGQQQVRDTSVITF